MGVNMKKDKKYAKQQIYKEHGKGVIVLVKSRDPNTKIQILKERLKSKSRSSKQSEGMGLFGW